MAKKKYFRNRIDRSLILRTNTNLPTLSLDTDPAALFTAEGRASAAQKFADAVEGTLSETAISSILREKEKPRETKREGGKGRFPPPPQAELDLHRLTAREAVAAADHFLQKARARKLNAVRIITGKGIHSQGEPVLRDVIEERLLAWKGAGLITAFRWEQQDKLLSGSAVVFLQGQ